MVDCQWCQVQKDGQTPLKSPYCDSQRVCFGGVVGAHSPYGDEISGEYGLGAPILCLVCVCVCVCVCVQVCFLCGHVYRVGMLVVEVCLLCVRLSCECVCCVSVCCVSVFVV